MPPGIAGHVSGGGSCRTGSACFRFSCRRSGTGQRTFPPWPSIFSSGRHCNCDVASAASSLRHCVAYRNTLDGQPFALAEAPGPSSCAGPPQTARDRVDRSRPDESLWRRYGFAMSRPCARSRRPPHVLAGLMRIGLLAVEPVRGDAGGRLDRADADQRERPAQDRSPQRPHAVQVERRWRPRRRRRPTIQVTRWSGLASGTIE